MCDECDFKTDLVDSVAALKHHKESVHEGIVYICNICPNYRTTNRKSFKTHNDTIHSQKEGNVCTEGKCSFRTNIKGRMLRHNEIKHEGIIRHRCDFMNCSYGTRLKKDFEKHILTHTDLTTPKPNKSYTKFVQIGGDMVER